MLNLLGEKEESLTSWKDQMFEERHETIYLGLAYVNLTEPRSEHNYFMYKNLVLYYYQTLLA